MFFSEKKLMTAFENTTTLCFHLISIFKTNWPRASITNRRAIQRVAILIECTMSWRHLALRLREKTIKAANLAHQFDTVFDWHRKGVCVKYCNEHFCLKLSTCITWKPHSQTLPIFLVKFTYGHGLILWWCCDMLYTSFSWIISCFHIMAIWLRVYSLVAIEHDSHHSQDFNQIFLNDKD